MSVLVAVQTFVLILLALLVAGLLRSHAEILRRLAAAEDGRDPAPAQPSGPSLPSVAAPMRDHGPAPDLVGTTLTGDAVKVGVSGAERGTLIAFLSSGCGTCLEFWRALQPPGRKAVPGDARLVVVTKSANVESPSKLAELAPSDLPVVMSSEGWAAYGVPVTPYFVYVDGPTGRIAGEGAAEAWAQIVSLVRDALADARAPEGTAAPPGSNGRSRASRADQELLAAGIAPDHPSLYEAGDPTAG